MKRSRVVLGVVLAPSALPLAYALFALLFSSYAIEAPEHLDQFLLGLLAMAIVCYAASYVLGAPVIACLLLARRLTCLPCIGLSILVGAAGGAAAYKYYLRDSGEIVVAALLGGCAALLVAAVFCAIAGVPWKSAPAGAAA